MPTEFLPADGGLAGSKADVPAAFRRRHGDPVPPARAHAIASTGPKSPSVGVTARACRSGSALIRAVARHPAIPQHCARTAAARQPRCTRRQATAATSHRCCAGSKANSNNESATLPGQQQQGIVAVTADGQQQQRAIAGAPAAWPAASASQRRCQGGMCARVSLGCGGTGEKSQVKGLDHKRLSGIVLRQHAAGRQRPAQRGVGLGQCTGLLQRAVWCGDFSVCRS
jgi:hypothetical protein